MQILEYYPPVVRQVKEIQQITRAEDKEFSKLYAALDGILCNMFISTADETGIERFEKILGIVPDASMTLEERKMYIFSAMNKCKMTLLELMFMLSAYSKSINLSCNYRDYELFVHLKEDVTGTRTIYNILDGFLPLQVYIIFVVELILSMPVPEEMDIVKTSLRTQVFFWDCRILNGTRRLDGSVHVDAKRRYGLVLGIRNGIKVYIKETMDTDGVNILSCFNVHENINGLKAVFKLGCSGFCRLLNNEVPLKMEVPVHASTVQCMDIPGLANGTVKVRAEEKTGTALACRAAVNSWRAPGQVLTAGTRHMAVVQVQEAIGDITVTYRRNLHYLDGSRTLDGSRLVNAFYGKEDI